VQLRVRLSVGRTGQCWDNALAESFFATLKGELLGIQPWPTRAAARSAIFEFIEGWYNLHRLHSNLGYQPCRLRGRRSGLTTTTMVSAEAEQAQSPPNPPEGICEQAQHPVNHIPRCSTRPPPEKMKRGTFAGAHGR
jgi:transposase InsO family protein